MHRFFSRAVAVFGAVLLALAITGCDAPTGDSKSGGTDGSGFVGTFKTQDTQGNPMTVTLDEEGSATGERAGDSLTGSWKEEEGHAVLITWSDGWSTKIAKDGDGYTKTAYKDGNQQGGTAAAEKIK